MKKHCGILVTLVALTALLLAACVSSDSTSAPANTAAQLLRAHPGPDTAGGHALVQAVRAQLATTVFGGPGPEVSGHYHPKARLGGTSRPCFLLDAARLILPAYGAYTGGLACTDPALSALMGPRAIAVLTGRRAIAMPMPRNAT